MIDPLRIALIAGEASGDNLGARLMRAISAETAVAPVFSGIGGPAMEKAGLRSLFPMADLSVMGVLPVLARLPLLLRRIEQTAQFLCETAPDVVVFIDAQDFCRRVAAKVRARRPDALLIGYVSPTVWAWRPGRAARLRPLLNHLMAVLPFEPEAHSRLGGPPCTYVGHPLVEHIDTLDQPSNEPPGAAAHEPLLLILPGSRRSEITRLMPPFGETVAKLHADNPALRFALPAVDHVEPQIRDMLRAWPVKPEVISGEAAKLDAFRRAHVALAASGTVTLELALARVPMVVAYKLAALEWQIAKQLVTVTTPVLPNLIVGRNAVPAYLQREADARFLAPAVQELIGQSPARAAQLAAFDEVLKSMKADGLPPSTRAARLVLELVAHHRIAAGSKVTFR